MCRHQLLISTQRRFQSTLIRSAQLRNRRGHNHMSVERNFQLLRNRLSQNIRRDSVFLCYLLDSRNVSWVTRQHNAARVFSKQRKLCGKTV